jgi:hypothetical protein
MASFFETRRGARQLEISREVVDGAASTGRLRAARTPVVPKSRHDTAATSINQIDCFHDFDEVDS